MKLSPALIVTTAASLWVCGAVAQTPPITVETVPDAFERAFSDQSKNIFHNFSAWGQIENILGWGFPENELAHDGEIVHSIYESAFKQQNESDPILRTLDLANPFDSSLRSNPAYLGDTLNRETVEFFFEAPPNR